MAVVAGRRLISDAPVFYVNGDGRTARIAERVAAGLRRHRLNGRAIRIGSPQARSIDWSSIRGAVVIVTLTGQRHHNEVHGFLSQHGHELDNVPSAFLSIALDSTWPNPQEQNTNQRLAESLPAIHGWRPRTIVSLPGRIRASHLTLIGGRVLKWLARHEGAHEAAPRDYEFTQWQKLDRVASLLAGRIHERFPERTTAA